MAMIDTLWHVGDIVSVLAGGICLAPHARLDSGERGEVISVENDAQGTYSANVRMDRTHEGLREWDNCALLVHPELAQIALFETELGPRAQRDNAELSQVG